MGAVYSLEIGVTFTTITCCHQGCGLTFAIPTWWEQMRRADRTFWYCPNGHSQHFSGETETEKLKKQLEAMQKSADYLRDSRNSLERRLKGQRAATSRFRHKLEHMKLRVGHGVCPCCHRTFQQLARHMQAKHPEWADQPEGLEVAETK